MDFTHNTVKTWYLYDFVCIHWILMNITILFIYIYNGNIVDGYQSDLSDWFMTMVMGHIWK